MSRTSRRDRIAGPARRHFLSVAGTATTKMMALASVLALSSTAATAGRQSHNGGGRGPRCLLKGTNIRTPCGERRIEDLRIGDLVVTLHGGAAPITWIGRNTYWKKGVSWHKDVAPVRIVRSAIEEDLPHRDLYLSPRHGLFIDGFLMPAGDLANDLSIASGAPSEMETLEYFQIETEEHAIIWAEGLSVETFFGDCYEAFDNFAEVQSLYPDGSCTKVPVAPNLGTSRAHLNGLVAVGISIFSKTPDPLYSAYARIAARGAKLDLAA